MTFSQLQDENCSGKPRGWGERRVESGVSGVGDESDGQQSWLVSQHHCRQDTLHSVTPWLKSIFRRTCWLDLRRARLVWLGLTWSDYRAVSSTHHYSASWLPTITHQTRPVTTHYHHNSNNIVSYTYNSHSNIIQQLINIFFVWKYLERVKIMITDTTHIYSIYTSTLPFY